MSQHVFSEPAAKAKVEASKAEIRPQAEIAASGAEAQAPKAEVAASGCNREIEAEEEFPDPPISELSLFPDDCLPPEDVYGSREELFAAINAWAAPRGYAFTTYRSQKEKGGVVRVIYACDRSCKPPSVLKERKRFTATRGTGCPFSVLAKQSKDQSTWALKHRPDILYSTHNHDPSIHESAHPTLRKLPKKDLAMISMLTKAGIASKQIMTVIRQNSNTMATQQDIYNRIAECKRKLREEQTNAPD